MSDDGIAEDSSRDIWRSQCAQLRTRMSAQIADEDALFTLLLAPLHLLDIVPNDFDDEHRQYCKWERLGLGAADKEVALRQYRWIGDVQSTLLSHILPDWYEVLRTSGRLELVTYLWFAPSPSASHRDSVGAVLLCALNTISNRLAALESAKQAGPSTPKLRNETWACLQVVLPQFLASLSLSDVALHCQTYLSKAQADLTWLEFVRNLLSIPDRIANAYKGKTPDALTAERIRGIIGAQAGHLANDDQRLQLTSVLVSKMLRAGWFSDVSHWKTDSLNVWPTLLSFVAHTAQGTRFDPQFRRRWRHVVAGLGDAQQVALISSLITTIDRHCLAPSHRASLLNHGEALRPGAEGTAFLSASTWNDALIVAQVIDLFVTGDDDTDIEDTNFFKALTVQLAGNASHSMAWSPLMARILLHLLQTKDATFASCEALLKQVVQRWAQKARTASWDEEVYTTLLLSLIVQTGLPDATFLNDLIVSPTFIQGVSKHLEHLSPSVRRFGMLIAEQASERSGKTLHFGKRAWEGRGEGREEARVIRSAALAFSGRAKENTSLTSDSVLAVLRLVKETESVIKSATLSVPSRKSTPPVTRTLPELTPAPARRPMMIQELDSDVAPALMTQDDTQSLLSLANLGVTYADNRKRHIAPLSDDEDARIGSSDEADSSSDEEATKARSGPAVSEEGKAFGSGTPTNKTRVRPPLYINELVPLLRQNEYEGVRMGLKHAEALITRKAGWGGEVDENAIDVGLALCALQNNFRIAHFDQRRLDALTALLAASPARMAPCLVEQYFVHQYSMAQRVTMLNALAFAAARLSGVKATGDDGHGQGKTRAAAPQTLVQGFAEMAMARARTEGEARLPEIRREKALLVNQPTTLAADGRRIVNSGRRAATSSTNRFLPVAASAFIFPLTSGLWTHLQDGNAIVRRSRFMGTGRGIIELPFMMGALLDTLAVLCHYAQNEPHFRDDIVPDVLQLVLTLTQTYLTDAATLVITPAKPVSAVGNDAIVDDDDGQQVDGGTRDTVLGAAASLVLVLLDAVWQLDSGASTKHWHARLLVEVQHWAGAVFEAAQGATTDRSIGALQRSGRCSAAILLRINEMQTTQREGRSM